MNWFALKIGNMRITSYQRKDVDQCHKSLILVRCRFQTFLLLKCNCAQSIFDLRKLKVSLFQNYGILIKQSKDGKYQNLSAAE